MTPFSLVVLVQGQETRHQLKFFSASSSTLIGIVSHNLLFALSPFPCFPTLSWVIFRTILKVYAKIKLEVFYLCYNHFGISKNSFYRADSFSTIFW